MRMSQWLKLLIQIWSSIQDITLALLVREASQANCISYVECLSWMEKSELGNVREINERSIKAGHSRVKDRNAK